MKYFAIALLVITIFVSAIFASSSIDNVLDKSMRIAKILTGQEKNQAAEDQQNAKRDSFAVGKSFAEGKDGLDDVEAMVGRGKNYLLTQVNNRLKQLGPFRTRVENMTTLSDSERKSLISELDAEIIAFDVFKSEINKSATKQDIKNVADKVKAEWLKSRHTVARAEKQFLAAKENQLVSGADAASLGIQKRIDALKASGKNTKGHEELLSAYGKKIASAKQDLASAQEKIDAIASAPTNDEKEKLIKGKDLLLLSAQDNIKDAYKMLGDEARKEFSQRYK
ncbi:hypothetical protein [Methylobacter sp. YRD-M1]|uniref:hypothetical protein n=1 Tax=Methylobacter sp. YRD-M1 TaxID=2911520 RepID=UPI00227D37BA|nr:hypothetical protein [Methylobacter sp. YRD-M1]WAK04122.1 hypothetical protein LZ558_10145 [Methylobacter sp. YRD-M1]